MTITRFLSIFLSLILIAISIHGMDIEPIGEALPQKFGFLEVCHGSKSIKSPQLLSKIKCIDSKTRWDSQKQKPYGFSDFISEGYGANGTLLLADLVLSIGVGAISGVLVGVFLLNNDKDTGKAMETVQKFKKMSWDYFPLTQKMENLKDDYPNFENNFSLTLRRHARDTLIPVGKHLIERQKLIRPVARKIRQQENSDLTFFLCLKNLSKTNCSYKLPKPLMQKIMNMQWWNDDLVDDCNPLIEHNQQVPSAMDQQFILHHILDDENRYASLSGYQHESQIPLQRIRLKNDVFKFGALKEFKQIFRKHCREIKKREAHLKKIVDYYSSSYIRWLPATIMESSSWLIPIIILCWGTKKMIAGVKTETPES